MPPKKQNTPAPKKATPRADYFRIQATMPQSQSDYLEALGSKCKQLHGFKLSKCEIIRSLISALQKVHGSLDLVEIKSEEELAERIREAFVKANAKKR